MLRALSVSQWCRSPHARRGAGAISRQLVASARRALSAVGKRPGWASWSCAGPGAACPTTASPWRGVGG